MIDDIRQGIECEAGILFYAGKFEEQREERCRKEV